MCLIPGRSLFLHFGRVKGFDLSRWRKHGADCFKCVPAFSLLALGMGWVIYCSSEPSKPQTLWHTAMVVRMGSWTAEAFIAHTPAGAVWCSLIQSHPAPSCPAFSVHLFRKGLKRSHKLQLVSLHLFKCSAGFLGKCFILDHQEFSVHVETVCTS